jgi:cobalamin biosynthesis Mg chelatase CobN
MTTGEAPAGEQELEAEIAETRERLGESVEQLVAKLDVKSQARARASRLTGQLTAAAGKARDQAKARVGQARDQAKARTSQAREQAATRPVPLAAAGGLLAVVLAVLIAVLRRRKR